MPLGGNYNWDDLVGGYGDALAKYYQGQESDFFTFLRRLAPYLARFLQTRESPQQTADPFAQFQKEYATSQHGPTVTQPQTNPLWQMVSPESIVPQLFGLGDIAAKGEAEVPGTAETWKSLMAEAPEEVWQFPFQTRPGEIFHPGLPTEVVSPEVTQQRERAETGRDWGLKILEPFLGEDLSLEGLKELSGILGQGGMETVLPQLYDLTEEGEDIYGKLPGWMRYATEEDKQAYIQKQIAQGARGEKQQPQYLWAYEKFKEGYKLENPSATEEETEKAFHQYKFGEEEKPFTTAEQTMVPWYRKNFWGETIPASVELKLEDIAAKERLAIVKQDNAALEQMDQLRMAEGFATREDEDMILKLIQTGTFGKTNEDILDALTSRDYSDDYAKYLLGRAKAQ